MLPSLPDKERTCFGIVDLPNDELDEASARLVVLRTGI
jgi:hypothetical protein